MKLLLTDSANALGRALEHELERESLRLLQPAQGDVDWSDEEQAADYIRINRPDAVVNTLAYTGLDDGLDPAVIATRHIANGAAKRQVPLIQLSSYQVFGSDNKKVHNEDDTPAPISPRGELFWQCEQAVALHPKHINLRFSWLIGSYGDNLLTRLLGDLKAGKPWQVNSRLRGAPTALSDAARVTVALVKQINCGADNWGIMHYCSSDAVTQLAFAEHVAEILRQQAYSGVEPEFQVSDTIPDDTPISAVLSHQRIRDDFGVQARSWRTSIVPMVKQWLSQQ